MIDFDDQRKRDIAYAALSAAQAQAPTGLEQAGLARYYNAMVAQGVDWLSIAREMNRCAAEQRWPT